MDGIISFLNSEKQLYLFAGLIGGVSVLVGQLFLLFSNHKSFAITMLVIGILEMALLFPTYLKSQQKMDTIIATYSSNESEFITKQIVATEKALDSFFWLKLTYGIVIVGLILGMFFLSPKSVYFGIAAALILHLSFAITIDNFGEIYTKDYLSELTESAYLLKT